MPSRLSWPMMGGPTAHPTGVTLASGDPSNSLTAHWGWHGSRPLGAAAPVFVLEAVRGRWQRRRWKKGAGRAVGHKVAFSSTEKAAQWSSIHLTAGKVVEWWFLVVVLVEVASGSGRRRLSGCSGWSGNSGHGGYRRSRGFVSSNFLVGLFKVVLEDPDLILHSVDQALHLGVRLFLEDFFDPPSGCDDVFHRSVTQFLNLRS